MNIYQYAKGLDIDLNAEYKASDAAKRIRIGVNLLNAAANGGELSYIQVGKKKRVYLGEDLIKWKLRKRTESATTTSQEIEADLGVEHGTTYKPSKEDLQALALKVFKTQS